MPLSRSHFPSILNSSTSQIVSEPQVQGFRSEMLKGNGLRKWVLIWNLGIDGKDDTRRTSREPGEEVEHTDFSSVVRSSKRDHGRENGVAVLDDL